MYSLEFITHIMYNIFRAKYTAALMKKVILWQWWPRRR